jgi:hypothetical protein
VTTHQNGEAHAVWQEYNDNMTTSIMFARSGDGVSWNISQIATGGNYSTSRRIPDVVVDDYGSILATWMFCDSTGNDFVQFSRSDDLGKTWLSPKQVSHGSPVDVVSMHTPRIAFTKGTIYISWSDDRNGDHDIWLAQSVDGGLNWGDGNIQPSDVRVDDTDNNGIGTDDETGQYRPDIIVSGFGVAVIWHDTRVSAQYDIYFARYELSTLQITEVSDSPDGSEWIEVHNFGEKPLGASPYSLSVTGNPEVDLDPLGTIGPREYRVIGDTPGADLYVNWDIPDEGVDVRLKKLGLAEEFFPFGQRGPYPDPLAGESTARYWSGERYSQDWTREMSS